ncbi:MAG: ammonia-forming cytochrome c nitrite reductase subunit c552 [Coriobacteriales bacterium]|jgi:nitrite reductase (cytochrome c-552)|nr:ammonia-forming cytochrome c nitrite reductase subunit c552 [Coriobacteriales bacterium]
MKGMNHRRFNRLLASALIGALLLVLIACAPKGGDAQGGQEQTSGPKTTVAAEPTIAKDAAGVWTAEAWKDIYPHEYETYMQNAMNTTEGNAANPHFAVRGDMVKMYPMLPVIWAGTAFNKFYNEPNGHNYSLDDIRVTGRVWDAEKGAFKETAFANCLTCKSADFTALYQQQGNAIFSQPIADINALLNEPISCYNCHENNLASDATASSVTATQTFFKTALGSDAGKVDAGSQSCGQCHNEYYFAPADKAVTNPYTGLAQMTPEAMYDYYKTAGKDGTPFVDYTNPNTGTQQLKTQHPEFEFVFGGAGSTMVQRGYGCVECHMGQPQTAEDGTIYTSHLLISPLENEELLATCNTGAGCHTDLKAQVKAWQKTSEDKVMAIGTKLETLNLKLADAVAQGTLSEAQLAEARELNREAQWYWDFVMVENSEGAHNPKLSTDTLAKSEAAVDKALTYF